MDFKTKFSLNSAEIKSSASVSKKPLSNKIPLVYELSKPQKADIKGCINMIPKINNNLKKKSFIMGDKGYVVNKKYYRKWVRYISD